MSQATLPTSLLLPLFQLLDYAPYNLIEDFRFFNLLTALPPLPHCSYNAVHDYMAICAFNRISIPFH